VTALPSPGAVSSGGKTVEVVVIGCAARAVLDAHAQGRVLAVFRRSFYAAFDDEVVCVGPPQLGVGPLNALTADREDPAWADAGIEVGAAVSCGDSALDVAGRIRFDFRAADVWQPPGTLAWTPATLADGLDLLARKVRLRKPGGLGALLAGRARDSESPIGERDDALLRAARPSVDALRDWLAAALAGAAVPPPVAALIGLGPGLTPSGDDWLGGAMIALRHFGRPDVAQRLADAVLAVAARNTSVISAAYLRCAARGEGSRVLFDALACLAAADQPTMDGRLDAIDAVGHTSGWDCLAGAALACAVLQASARSTSTASSAACAFDGAAMMPASSSRATCRE
jgi:hypothetical protein